MIILQDMAPNDMAPSCCIPLYLCLSPVYLPKEPFSGNQTRATQIYKTTKAEGIGCWHAASGKTIATEPVVIFNGEGEG